MEQLVQRNPVYICPALNGLLNGASLRVPVMSGLLTELTAVVRGSITADTIGMAYGGLFDATQTKATGLGNGTLVKIAAWYDNESSFVTQMVKTAAYMAQL